MSKQLKILVGCEFSGTVRDAFRSLGHDALSCDLLPSEAGGPHYRGDVLDLLNEPWNLAIFHPPCTYLTNSAEWCYKDDPGKKMRPGVLFGAARRQAREEALAFVQALMNAPIPAIAIENPVGCISTRIRKPDQIIQPYNFGSDASKSTCLWLKGLPPLTGTQYVKPRMVCPNCNGWQRYEDAARGCLYCFTESGLLNPRWANQTNGGQNRLAPSADRWAERSITYPGIAEAMAKQWSQHLLKTL